MRISYSHAVYIFIAALTAFRIWYVIAGVYPLAPDEAYFWEWSRHPDWSYYDMGPMVALIISVFTKIFGATELGVRFGAILLSAGVSVIVYHLAAEMFGSGRIGFTTAFLTNITPIGAAGSFIMTYYSPQVFLWALSLFLLHRAVSTGKGGWWYGLGASLGLGLLSHHLFFVLSAQVALYLFLSSEGRRWIIRKEPYIAAVIALDLFLPVLIWNVEHDMVMFRHATGLMGRDVNPWIVFGDFIGGQAGVISPLLFLAAVAAIGISAYRGLYQKDDRWLFLFCTSAPILVFIGSLSLGRRVEANWPVSAYVAAFIALSALYHLRERKKTWHGVYAGISVSLALFIAVVGHYPSLLVPLYDLPPRLDTSNRLYGWRDLGLRLGEIRKDMPWSFLAATDYGITSEIAFYTPGHPPTYCLPVARRFNAFDFFGDAGPEKGRDALFVTFGPGDLDPRIAALFDRVAPREGLIIYKHGQASAVRQTFSIFRCYGFKGIPRGEAPTTY